MNDARRFFDALNHDYAAVHKAKEDLFWATYMGMSDDHAGFRSSEAESDSGSRVAAVGAQT